MFWSSPLDTPGSVQNGITNLLFKETANENKLGLKAGHLSAVKDNPGFLRMKLCKAAVVTTTSRIKVFYLYCKRFPCNVLQ